MYRGLGSFARERLERTSVLYPMVKQATAQKSSLCATLDQLAQLHGRWPVHPMQPATPAPFIHLPSVLSSQLPLFQCTNNRRQEKPSPVIRAQLSSSNYTTRFFITLGARILYEDKTKPERASGEDKAPFCFYSFAFLNHSSEVWSQVRASLLRLMGTRH